MGFFLPSSVRTFSLQMTSPPAGFVFQYIQKRQSRKQTAQLHFSKMNEESFNIYKEWNREGGTKGDEAKISKIPKK